VGSVIDADPSAIRADLEKVLTDKLDQLRIASKILLAGRLRYDRRRHRNRQADLARSSWTGGRIPDAYPLGLSR